MNIDIKDVITLDDDNEYVVVSKVNYNDETFFYIVNTNISEDNNEDGNVGFKILKLNKENQKLAEFDDENLVKTLIPLFFKETASYIEAEKATENID